jgi:hypothetical protein
MELSRAQRERLEVLAEEASEVVQQSMKILRHGYQTTDHVTGTIYDNQIILMDELLELWTIMERMTFHGDIWKLDYNRTGEVWKQKMRYMHHQPPFHDPHDPPEPIRPTGQSNAWNDGWKARLDGRVRDSCGFPQARPDLHIEWKHGWDAADMASRR